MLITPIRTGDPQKVQTYTALVQAKMQAEDVLPDPISVACELLFRPDRSLYMGIESVFSFERGRVTIDLEFNRGRYHLVSPDDESWVPRVSLSAESVSVASLLPRVRLC